MAEMHRLSDTSTHGHVFQKGPGTHLVLAGHIHLVAEKLGEMHDSHGCWASQEAHPCLVGERHPRTGVHPGTLSQPTPRSWADPSTHFLLVTIPIFQGALLLFPVPAEGEGMKQGRPWCRQDLTAHIRKALLEAPFPPRGMGTAWEKGPSLGPQKDQARARLA